MALSPGVRFSSPPSGAEEGEEFSYATAFPQPYTMAAAFDDVLWAEVGGVIGTEARAFGNAGRAGRNWWSPTVNLFRDPRWGRGQEGPGEDGLVGKRYVRGFVGGLQQQVDDKGRWMVMATCKHVAGYDLEDWHGTVRYGFDARVEVRDLAEYYMQPFQECARDVGVSALMCSYNSVNGVPACADPYLMQDLVREHWGWGREEAGTYVVSDCGAVRYAFSDHGYRGTREEVVAESLRSGVDLDCGYYYPDYLGSAVKKGLLSEEDLDQALVRLYSGLVRTGFFDADDPWREIGWKDVATPEARKLALTAAEEGIVLLKNDGVLPLKMPEKGKLKLAVFGSWANATVEMQGNYQGVAQSIKSPIEALEQLDHVEVVTADWERSKYEFVKGEKPDVVITIDGNRLEDAKETRDRDRLEWHGDYSDTVFSLGELGIPIIVVNLGEQFDSGPYLRDDSVSAILYGGYGGQAGGEALANILAGKAAPAGRLPVTQYPLEYVYSIDLTDMALRPDPETGRPGRTYRWYNNATFAFGYGLHYTTFSTALTGPKTSRFSIADLVAQCDSSKHLDLCPFRPEEPGLSVRVTNTGNAESDFVLLAFIAGEFGELPYPFKTLVDYTRVQDIRGGKSADVELSLTLGGLARHDAKGNQILYPGKYRLLLEEPSEVVWEFELVGEEAVLDLWPQPRSSEGSKLKSQDPSRSDPRSEL